MTITVSEAKAMQQSITQGPWKADHYECEVEIYAERTNESGDTYPALGEFYIYVASDAMAKYPLTEANARAIAAVPKMLETIIAMGAEQADDRKRIGEAVEAIETARVLIGAKNDNLAEAVRQSNVNRAWHELTNALASLSKPLSDGE